MKPEDEIIKKLAELEATLDEAEDNSEELAATTKGSKVGVNNSRLPRGSASGSANSLNSDLQLIGGFALIGVALLMILNHVRIGTGMLTLYGFGGGGAGFLVLPFLIGIGFMFYDYKNKIGWFLTGGGLTAILFVVLSQLVMYFPHLTLLSFIFMFVPLAAGGALVAKGLKAGRELETKNNDS